MYPDKGITFVFFCDSINYSPPELQHFELKVSRDAQFVYSTRAKPHDMLGYDAFFFVKADY